MIFSGPTYMLWQYFGTKRRKTSPTHHHVHHGTEKRDIIDPEKEETVEDQNRRSVRIIASYLVLAVICLIPIGINYGLLYVANHKALKVLRKCPPRPTALTHILSLQTPPTSDDHSGEKSFGRIQHVTRPPRVRLNLSVTRPLHVTRPLLSTRYSSVTFNTLLVRYSSAST